MIRLLSFIKNYWIVVTAFTLTAITTLSLWPMETLPSVPGSDKSHHFIAYALLMFPTALRKPNRWKGITLFFVIYSGGIELVQPYVNRYGEWLDLAANATGLLCGLILVTLINYLFPKHLNYSP